MSMEQTYPTGLVAASLRRTEPETSELVRRGKIVPSPPVISGRRAWTRRHVLQAARHLGLDPEAVVRVARDEEAPRPRAELRDPPDKCRPDHRPQRCDAIPYTPNCQRTLQPSILSWGALSFAGSLHQTYLCVTSAVYRTLAILDPTRFLSTLPAIFFSPIHCLSRQANVPHFSGCWFTEVSRWWQSFFSLLSVAIVSRNRRRKHGMTAFGLT
mgnify:CR=1 FL=1